MPKLKKLHTRRNGSKSVAETLARWKEHNDHLDSSNDEGKTFRKAPAKGSKKGCMKAGAVSGFSSVTTAGSDSSGSSNQSDVCGAEDHMVKSVSTNVTDGEVIQTMTTNKDEESQ
ncbi:hypothetical protein FEM48_Zijuj04G0124100 [Ziziphus jujuba var. spinosa]|uniref:Uncharacterized protein n=1 Tax=Ziziphus jujuba var. spinosa TaxID=714518 RepID=A0A978VJV6_ZIZJJ|nr:hypothetical protein FEM48_Zijuj04G0124100 [Ziziphus jujuba var. spinosa]